MTSWFKAVGDARITLKDIEDGKEESEDELQPVNFGVRETPKPVLAEVQKDVEHYQRKPLSRDYEKEDSKEITDAKLKSEKTKNEAEKPKTSLNLNGLDFIIEQLENLPDKKFDNQKIIYERRKRNKKQEDEDFLAELEAKAETDHQKDTVKKKQHNESTEPKTKFFHKIKRQPTPLVQDLRPEVIAREKAEKELTRKTLKSTSDILQDQAAAERVARLSRMRPDSSDSDEDSSDDEQDQSYLQRIRENIKKNNSTITVVHRDKPTTKIEKGPSGQSSLTSSGTWTCNELTKWNNNKTAENRNPTKMSDSKPKPKDETQTNPQVILKYRQSLNTDSDKLANSRIIFDLPTSNAKSLSNAEAGALTLYRQYLSHHNQIKNSDNNQKVETSAGQSSKRTKKGHDKKEVLSGPLNLKLQNLAPLFDCEISRRPVIPAIDQNEKGPVVLLTIQMASVNEMVFYGQNKGSKNYLVDSKPGAFGLSFALTMSWVLGLVAENDNSSDDNEQKKAPFKLSGLQLVTRNNLTYIDIFIVPTKTSQNEKIIREKSSKKRKNHSEFEDFLSKVRRYLSSVKLSDVTSSWANGEDSPITHLLNETEWYFQNEKPLSSFIHPNSDENAASRILNLESGFEWSQVQSQNDTNLMNYKFSESAFPPENCFGLILGDAFSLNYPILEMFIKVNFFCMDITALRLVWLTQEEFNTVTISSTFGQHSTSGPILGRVPCLALCVRGANAIQNWQGIVGPRNCKVARYTDQYSLSSIYGDTINKNQKSLVGAKSGGTSHESCIFYSPRSNERSHELMMQFFTGQVSDNQLKQVESNKINREIINAGRSSQLTAVGYQSLLVILSPRLPIRFLSDCLQTIQQYGFQIETIKRQVLNQKQLKFIDEETKLMDSSDTKQPTILIEISRENALQHIGGFMNRLQEEMLSPILSTCQSGELQTLLYSTIMVKPLTNELLKLTSQKNPCPSFDSWSPKPWLKSSIDGILPVEQTVCLVISGAEYLTALGLIMVELLHGGGLLDLIDSEDFAFESSQTSANGFEMIGIKYSKGISQFQAREVCPFEVGDPRFLTTMISLYNQPACCIVLRRFNAIQILFEYKKKLRTERKVNLTITNSATWTHRVIKSFFDNSELYQDEFSRPHAKYLPPKQYPDHQTIDRIIFDQRVEVIKAPILIPPRLRRQLPQVTKRIESLNLKFLSLRLFPQLSENQAESLISETFINEYAKNEPSEHAWVVNTFKKLWQSGPVHLIIVEGVDVIRSLNIYFNQDEDLSNDIESQFDNVWVPNSFVHAESVIDALCPAGPSESKKDFDIALSSASLNYLKDEQSLDESILLIFELKNSPMVFDKLQRSNFCILGLRTARLHSKTAAQIFDEKIQDIGPIEKFGQLLYCVVTRRSCLDILQALNLPILYSSPSVLEAEAEIPKLFAELLIL